MVLITALINQHLHRRSNVDVFHNDKLVVQRPYPANKTKEEMQNKKVQVKEKSAINRKQKSEVSYSETGMR
jgi:hypothetical protein